MKPHKNQYNHKACKSKTHYLITQNGDDRRGMSCRFCLDHEVIFCRCGYEFGHHEYQIKIKPRKKCCMCGAKIEKKDYELRGNFCLKCNTFCANVDKKRAILS